MTIKSILDEISRTPGTNDKMKILKKYEHNKLLRDVIYLALSRRIKFYIKQIPNYTKNPIGNGVGLDSILESLEAFCDRSVTGNHADRELKKFLEYLSEDDAYVLEKIILKDLRIGMGRTNINKVLGKDFLETTPYMGAKPFEESLVRQIFANNKDAYSQIKMDGRYLNAIISDGSVNLESRGGEPNPLLGAKFVAELVTFPDCVLNGELTIDGKTRYESNGIVASLVSIGQKQIEGEDISEEQNKFLHKHGMTHSEGLNTIRYTVWDIITIEEYLNGHSATEYDERLFDLIELIATMHPSMVSLIESKVVRKYDEAIAHFQSALARGEEGTIVKAATGIWQDGKPKWQVKMKLEISSDLRIVGFNYGTGKNEKLISSLNAESSCGLVSTSPAGIDEDTMEFITKNQSILLGTIVEVKSAGLSKDSKGKLSLLHPVFKMIRTDKFEADSYDVILANEKMAKGLK